jgi:Protein of unknown function (DUF1573)
MSPWKIAFGLIGLLFAGLIAWAGERGWAWATGRAGPPDGVDTLADVAPARPEGGLRFAESEVRIETKSPTAAIRQEFPFTNTGAFPVRITKVRTSCARCSSGKPTRDVYASGEHGVIVLEVDASGQPAGPKPYLATVEYRDPEPREARLILVVDYEPEVQVVPSTMTLTLTAGKSATGRFRIIDSRAGPFISKRFTTSAKSLRVTAEDQGREGPVQEFEVSVRDTADLPFGQTVAHVTIREARNESQSWTLPVTVEKVPRIRAAPSPLYLKGTAGGGAEGKIIVTDVEGEEIVIEKVEVVGDKVEVRFDREARLRPIIVLQSRNAADVRFPITVRISVERPCRQAVIVTIAGLSS